MNTTDVMSGAIFRWVQQFDDAKVLSEYKRTHDRVHPFTPKVAELIIVMEGKPQLKEMTTYTDKAHEYSQAEYKLAEQYLVADSKVKKEIAGQLDASMWRICRPSITIRTLGPSPHRRRNSLRYPNR